MSQQLDSEARLSWLLAGLAGVLGAAAFTHSAGYFVTFMTGNTERAFLGLFQGEEWLAIGVALLVVSGSQMLLVATVICGIAAAYTYFYFDRHALLK